MYFPVGERSKVSGWKSGHNVRIPIQPEQVRTHPISNRKLLVIVWQLKMAKKQKIGKKSKKVQKIAKKEVPSAYLEDKNSKMCDCKIQWDSLVILKQRFILLYKYIYTL